MTKRFLKSSEGSKIYHGRAQRIPTGRLSRKEEELKVGNFVGASIIEILSGMEGCY
jgi:hypothetical protein